jgi:uncharacterized protein (DUF433 family)
MSALLSAGLYSVPEAARLLGEQTRTIRRWAFGYRRRGRYYDPAIFPDAADWKGPSVLTFLDLVELLFIQGCLKAGVSWPKVRAAAETAARLLRNEPHPFALKKWFADPAGVYLMLGERDGEDSLVEVAGDAQVAMREALSPYLDQLDFDMRGVAERWFPLGPTEPILVDPRRAFGAPIVQEGGIRTDVLAGMHDAGDSFAAISAWFEVEEHEVRAAVAYEHRKAA